MGKKKTLAILFLGWLVSMMAVFPGTAVAGVNTSVENNEVVISGDTIPGEWVNISVEREDGKRAYIGQVRAAEDGDYRFNFQLDKGSYRYFLSAEPSPGNILVKNTGGGNSSTPIVKENIAYLTIQGDTATGTILSGVTFKWDGANCTVIELLEKVLDSKGIAYDIRGAYVRSIGGLAEKKPGYPMSGWLYSVNGSFPSVGAAAYLIKNGDQVKWLYSLDGSEGIKEPVPPETINDIARLIAGYSEQLKGLEKVRLLNQERQMSDREAGKLQELLAANKVVLKQTIQGEDAWLSDPAGEITVLIPAGAVTDVFDLQVQEQDRPTAGKYAGIRFCSPVYEFEPDGAEFAAPVTIVIKAALFGDMDVNSITPAWYDEEQQVWVPVPALVNLQNGTVVFQVNHFTRFAIIEFQEQPEEEVTKEAVFTDIGPEFSWAQPAIENLAMQGIIKGTGEGLFEPRRAITRAEFVQLEAAALEMEAGNSELHFTDVSADDWFVPALVKVYGAGLISGYPDGTFRPGSSINRYEAAVCLHRWCGQPEPSAVISFTDKQEIPAWAWSAVNYAGEQQLLQGYEDGSYRGSQVLNRAEAACLIYRLLEQ